LASSGAVFDQALSIFILPVWAFLLKSRQAVLLNEERNLEIHLDFWFLKLFNNLKIRGRPL